ncbi:MAG: signal recognition particle subunit SRP19/SEC65 family protein [Candidatus Bathyarchaeia archaeon]|nr:signal recognition particle protein Srp19 [Candidatus Bathyarchaeota archaeon]
MRRRDEVVLWPVYFDSTKTRSKGRKVPKKLSKPSPNLGVLEKAVANLGFSYKVVMDAAYPRFSWKKSGLVLVKKTKAKNRIIIEVAHEISRLMV